MSLTLPEFVFREFVETDEAEIPGLIKDDGFRKSIVTATGEHKANLFQFQRTRGIKVSDNSSPRTSPGDFADLLDEEYDDEVFESPSRSSCVSTSTVINSAHEVVVRSTKPYPKSTDGSVFHEEEDFYTDECEVLTTRGEIRPLLVKKTRGKIRLDSSDHHTGCKLLSKDPISSKSTNSSSSGAYTSAESVTPTKSEFGVQKYSPLALDDFGHYSNFLDCHNQSSESIGMDLSLEEPSPIDLEARQEHFQKKAYTNDGEEYPLEYEDQFRRQVIPDNDLHKKATMESQSVKRRDKATDTEESDEKEDSSPEMPPIPSEKVFNIEKVVCDWIVPQSKRERKEKEKQREEKKRKAAGVLIDAKPLSADLVNPQPQKECFLESKGTKYKAKIDDTKSALLKYELKSMKEKADNITKELKSVVNSIRSPTRISKPLTKQGSGVASSFSLPSLKQLPSPLLQQKTSTSFTTLESLRPTTSPFAPGRKNTALLKAQLSNQSLFSSSSVGTLVSSSTSHLADDSDKMEFQVGEVPGSDKQNPMNLSLPDIDEVLMNSNNVKISSLASKEKRISAADCPNAVQLKMEQVHKNSVSEENKAETVTAPSTPIAKSPQQTSKPRSPFLKNLVSILTSLPATPLEKSTQDKIPEMTVTPPASLPLKEGGLFKHTLSSATVTDSTKAKASQFEQGVASMATITPASPPAASKDASFTQLSRFEQGMFSTATITPGGSPPPAHAPAKGLKSHKSKSPRTNFLLAAPPIDMNEVVVPTFKTPGSPPPVSVPMRHLSPSPFDLDGSVIRFTFPSVQRVLPTILITPPSPCHEDSSPQSMILQMGKGCLPTILLTPPSPLPNNDKDMVATISVDCITQQSQFRAESPSKESNFSIPSVDTRVEAAKTQLSPQSQLSLSSVDLRSPNSLSVHSAATSGAKDPMDAPMPQVLIRWDHGIIPALVMTPATPPNETTSTLETTKAGERAVKSTSEHTCNRLPHSCTSDGKLAEEDLQFFINLSTQTQKLQELSKVQVDRCLALVSIPTPSPHNLAVRCTDPEVFKFTPETYNSISISKKNFSYRSSLITKWGLSKSAPSLLMKLPSLDAYAIEEFEVDSLNSNSSLLGHNTTSVAVSGNARKPPHLSTPISGVSFALPPKWDTGAKPAKSDHNTPNASSPNQIFTFEPAAGGAALEFDDHSTSLPSLTKDTSTCPIIILNNQPMVVPEDDGYSFSVPFKPLLNLPESPKFGAVETSSSSTSTSEYSTNFDSQGSSKKGGSLSSMGSNTPKENSDGKNRRSSMSSGRSTSRKSVQFALSTKPGSTSSSEKDSIASSLIHCEERSSEGDSTSYSLKNNCGSVVCSSGETSSIESAEYSPRLFKSKRDYKLAKKLQRYELLSSSTESFQSSNYSPNVLKERTPLSARVEFRDSVPSLRSSLFAGKRKSRVSEFATREISQKKNKGYSFDGAEQECASLCSAVPKNVEALLQGRDFSPVVYERTVHTDIDSPGPISNRNANPGVDSVTAFEYENMRLSKHTDTAVCMTASSIERELSNESIEPYFLYERNSACDSVADKNAGTDSGPSIESYLLPLESQFSSFSSAKRCESTTSRSAPSVMSSPDQSKVSLHEKTSSPPMEKIGDLIVTFKCERANSAPSIHSYHSKNQPSCPVRRPSVYFRPSVKLENAIATAVDLKHGLEATIAILSSTARSNTMHRRSSATAIDSPLQCPPPPPTPVSSENLIPPKITMNEKLKYAEIDSAHKKYLKMLSTATPLMQRILTTSGWPAVAFLLEEPIEPYSSEAPEWFQAIQRQGDPSFMPTPVAAVVEPEEISKCTKEPEDVGELSSIAAMQEALESINTPPPSKPEATNNLLSSKEPEDVSITVSKDPNNFPSAKKESCEDVNCLSNTAAMSGSTNMLPSISAANEPESIKPCPETEPITMHQGDNNPTREPEMNMSNQQTQTSVTDTPETPRVDEASSQDDKTPTIALPVPERPRAHQDRATPQPATPQPLARHTNCIVFGEMVVGQTPSKQATLAGNVKESDGPAYPVPQLSTSEEPQVDMSENEVIAQDAYSYPSVPQSNAKEPQDSASTVPGQQYYVQPGMNTPHINNGAWIGQHHPQSRIEDLQLLGSNLYVASQQYPSTSMTNEPQVNNTKTTMIGQQYYPPVTKQPQAMVNADMTGQQYSSSVPYSATEAPLMNFVSGNTMIDQRYALTPPPFTEPEMNTGIVNTMTGQRYHSMSQPTTKAPQVNMTNENTYGPYPSLPVVENPQAQQSFGGAANQAPTHFQFPSAFSNYAPQVSVVNSLEPFPNTIPVYNPTGMYNEMGYSLANDKAATTGPCDAYASHSRMDYTESEMVYPPPVNTNKPGMESSNLTKVSTPVTSGKRKVTSQPKKKNTRKSLSQRARLLQSHLVTYSDTSESEVATSKTRLTHPRRVSKVKDGHKKAHNDVDTKCAKVDSSTNSTLLTLVSDCYFSGSQTSSELELASSQNCLHSNDREKKTSIDKPDEEKNDEEKKMSVGKPTKISENNAGGGNSQAIVDYSGEETSPTSLKSYLATNGTSNSRLLSETSTGECSIDIQQSVDGSMADIVSVTDNFLSYMSSLGTSSDDVSKPGDDSIMAEQVASSSNPESQATFYSHETHSSYVSTGMCPATHCIPADKGSASALPQKVEVPVETGLEANIALTLPETDGAKENVLSPGETGGDCVPSPSCAVEGTNENKPLKLKLLVPPKNEGAKGAGLKRDHRILPPKLKLVPAENKPSRSKHASEKKPPARRVAKTSSTGGVPSGKIGVSSGKLSHSTSTVMSKAASDGGVEVKSDGVSSPTSAMSINGSFNMDIASPSGGSLKKQQKKRKSHRIKKFLNSIF